MNYLDSLFEADRMKTSDDLISRKLEDAFMPKAEMTGEIYSSNNIETSRIREEKEVAPMNMDSQRSDSDQDILDIIELMNQSEEPDLELASAQEDYIDPDALFGELGIDEELLKLIPDINQPDEAMDGLSNKTSKNLDKQKSKEGGLWKQLFANVKEELSQEELEEKKQQLLQEAKQIDLRKKEKVEAKNAKKQQAKLKKTEKQRLAKDQAVAKKAKAEAKKKAKKEEKERRSRDVQNLVDEIEVNEGRINKVGASIVFVFFASLAIVIVVGTNLFSYSIGIKNATESFEHSKYNQAYQSIHGIQVREEDLEIYNKIMTVMYVNKQLNSYYNFINMDRYPEALDSLLKGLERYDKYYELASLHGIEKDLNSIREQIVIELQQTFFLTEDEAIQLLAFDDQVKYSLAVHDIAKDLQ